MSRELRDMMERNYETLMLAYAAGLLDMAQSLAMATHIALSPRARDFARQCEAIGGCLIEKECEPVAMSRGCLDSVLSRLDEPGMPQRAAQQKAPHKVALPEDVHLPEHVLECVSCRPCHPRWKKLAPSIEAYDLPLECRQSAARFIKARPAAKLPAHSHAGLEITLVLDGSYMDEFGMHRRGDLIVLDEECRHAPSACREQGAMALVVSSGPARLTGLLSLLNPFLKF